MKIALALSGSKLTWMIAFRLLFSALEGRKGGEKGTEKYSRLSHDFYLV